jgi:hypothetical protein
MRDFVMSNVPFPKRILFGYRGNVRKLHEQGLGRFSEDEIRSFRSGIWESVNAFMEESRRYASAEGCFWVLGGYEPTEADTTVYGFVVSVLVVDPRPRRCMDHASYGHASNVVPISIVTCRLVACLRGQCPVSVRCEGRKHQMVVAPSSKVFSPRIWRGCRSPTWFVS